MQEVPPENEADTNTMNNDKLVFDCLFNKLCGAGGGSSMYKYINESQWKCALNKIAPDTMTIKDKQNLFQLIVKFKSNDHYDYGHSAEITKENWIDFCMTSCDINIQSLKDSLLTAITDYNIVGEIEDISMICYQWKMPSRSSLKINLISYGYCRQNRHKFIPYDIIKIIESFISNHEIIDEIKGAKNGNEIKSGSFNYKSYKFLFDFYPNGEYDWQNECDWSLIWIGASQNASKIEMCVSFIFMENNIILKQQETRTISGLDDIICLTDYGIDIKHHHIQPLNSFTFNLYIHKFTVYDEHENIIFCDEFKPSISPQCTTIDIEEQILEENKSIYRWQLNKMDIERIKPRETITSSVFLLEDLKWNLRLYPFGDGDGEEHQVHLALHLVDLPLNIKSVKVHYKIQCSTDYGLQKIQQITLSFSDGDMSAWESNILPSDDIINSDNIQFYIEMVLLTVIDIEDNHINIDVLEQKDREIIQSPIKSFKWQISDEYMVEKIKKSDRLSTFKSGIFELFGFEWMIEITPHKRIDKDENVFDAFMAQLNLCTLPLDIASIAINYILKLHEGNCSFSWLAQFSDSYSLNEWDDDLLSLSQIENIDSFTFSIDMELLNVYDSNGNDITSNIINNNYDDEELAINIRSFPSSQYFEWIASSPLIFDQDASIGNTFIQRFVMFGFKFYIKLTPKWYKYADTLSCYIGLQTKPPNISEFACHLKLSIKELQFVTSNTVQFRDNKMEWEWLSDAAPYIKIQNLTQLSIGVEMSLLDVYTQNNVDHIKEEKIEDITKEFKWKIDIKSTDLTNGDNVDSQYFEMINDIKFKMIYYAKGQNKKNENSEIFIFLKCFREVIGLSVMYELLMNNEVNICGVSHFKKDQVLLQLTDTVELNLTAWNQIDFVLKLTPIAIYYDDQIKIKDYKSSEWTVLRILDHLINTFSH